MSDELNDLAKSAAQGAAEGFGKTVIPPIYPDLLQPATKQAGKALETLAGVINISLAPLQAMVWGYERISTWLSKSLEEKLQDVPAEKIQSPDPAVAGPSIEALRFAANDVNLRELYSNLISKSMNSDTRDLAHPAYVEIIKNLSANEAILFKTLSSMHTRPVIDVKRKLGKNDGYTLLESNVILLPKGTDALFSKGFVTSAGIINLLRLGLIDIPTGQAYTHKPHYEPLKQFINRGYQLTNLEIKLEEKVINLTVFGDQFKKVCID